MRKRRKRRKRRRRRGRRESRRRRRLRESADIKTSKQPTEKKRTLREVVRLCVRLIYSFSSGFLVVNI